MNHIHGDRKLKMQLATATAAMKKASDRAAELVSLLYPPGAEVQIQWGRGYARCIVEEASKRLGHPSEIFVRTLNETTNGRGHWVCLSRVKGFTS